MQEAGRPVASDLWCGKMPSIRSLALIADFTGEGISGVLARGTAAHAYEAGQLERTVLIEFDSVEHAIAVHDSPRYQAALAALGGGAVRDMRVVAGL
jgi:uncharacterized protein (DUF1330 family)